MDNLKWSLDLLNLFQADESTTNTTMQAHDPILYNGSKRKPIEEVIDLVEDRIVVSWVLAETIATFLGESESIVDPFILMITSQQVDVIGISYLESHQ